MSVKQSIKVTNAGLSPILSVAQGTGAIEYEFTVSDFDIPSGSAAVAYNIQPTGNIVSQTCSISGNTITIKPPAYYFLRGKNYMQLQVSKSNEDLFSFLIEIWCAPNISQPEVIVAENPSLVSQLISDVGLLSAQLDNLLSIPSGSLSTSSDAALADIKIGYDGTTYNTPGDAVRGQVSSLSEDIKNSIIYDVTGEKIKGSAIDTRDGTIRDFEKSISGDFIDVSDRNAVFYYTGNTYNYLGIAGYDDNGDYIQSILDSTDNGLVNFKNYRLDIPENVKKIRASSFGTSDNVGSMYNAEPFSVFKKYDVSSISGETQNLKEETQNLKEETQNLKEETQNLKNDKTMNHIYVSVNGSDASGDGTKENPYKTIYHANDIINDNSPEKQYIIHVADGTYNDLQARYNGIVGDTYQGVICKDYVYYIGNTKSPEKVIISWDGSTGFENPVLDDVFRKAPFHITGNNGLGCHTSIRGFSFECKNLRYPIHVETSGYGEDVEWTIENCDFRMWSGRPDVLSDNSQSRPSIGMGSSYFEEGCIRNCVFPEPIEQAGKTWSLGIVNHDNIRNNFNPYCKVGATYTIENCSFNGSDIMLRSGYKDATYDVKNIATIKNCTGINKLTYQISSEIVTEIMWNVNVICSEINQNSFN